MAIEMMKKEGKSLSPKDWGGLRGGDEGIREKPGTELRQPRFLDLALRQELRLYGAMLTYF